MNSAADKLVLYRFFDADDGLLYVGISVNVWARFSQHRQDSAFFPEAATVTMQRGFASSFELLAAETAAIRAEKPRFNVHKRQKPAVPQPTLKPPVNTESDGLLTGAIKQLNTAGFTKRPAKGSHTRWTCSRSTYSVVIPTHSAKVNSDIRHQVNKAIQLCQNECEDT